MAKLTDKELKSDGTPYKSSRVQRQRSLAYYQEHREEIKAKMIAYYRTDKGKEANRRYKQSERGRAVTREGSTRRYWQNPEKFRTRARQGGHSITTHIYPLSYTRHIRLTIPVEILIEPDDGKYHAWCPSLKGLHTEGYCLINGVANAKIAAEAYILSLIKHNEPIPLPSHTESKEG